MEIRMPRSARIHAPDWKVFREKWGVPWKPGDPMGYPAEQIISRRFEPVEHYISVPRL